MKRRVVVTGLGMLSPLGNNVKDSWEGILAGQSGVRLIDFFDVTDFSSKISGSVKHFDPSAYLSVKDERKIDRFIQFAIVAAGEALKDSGLVMEDEDATRIGTAIGAGICGLPAIEKSHEVYLKSGPRKLSPFFIPAIVTNMASGNVSIQFGLKGPCISVVSACATGTHNIGEAARMIDYGDADVMVCGGAEMATSPLGLGGFAALRALSTRNDEPEKASRPWDKDRDGFVLGDGAGVLVVEELEHAKKRGAKIYAEIVGYGKTADAYHITALDPDGAARSIDMALKDAHLNPG
ncbi:MAG: beta-ketoacyl-ACP synthase II, partial [Gammaproteobacteria bacterium]|nr:beta-ketoacyl-ACP synthase II [Gammaproteobacteria bacterium]